MNFSYATLVTLQDANGKNHINGIENLFSKRMRLISSKQSPAKHKSCDLRCYCFLKGYERRVKQSGRGYAKHRLSKFKEIFSSVATVGKLGKENFFLHLKECVLLYLTMFVVFKDAATSVAKQSLDINNGKDTKTSEALTK